VMEIGHKIGHSGLSREGYLPDGDSILGDPGCSGSTLPFWHLLATDTTGDRLGFEITVALHDCPDSEQSYLDARSS
jgi:hypothetical protein